MVTRQNISQNKRNKKIAIRINDNMVKPHGKLVLVG